MTHHITVQYAADRRLAPTSNELCQWAETALNHRVSAAEVTIRIVNKDEMTQLNMTYRHKNKPTNVLSFPAPADIQDITNILGDIVICAAVVNDEATEQGKQPQAHWAHMTVHGIFHLLGFNHEDEGEAKEMEKLEIGVMTQLGFPNPYDSNRR